MTAPRRALIESATVAFSCPAVRDEASLRTAIRYAEGHPPARVFPIKGAYRLGLAHLLPDWPELAGTVVQTGRVAAVITASGSLAHQRTGAPVGAPRPTRRQRGARPVKDRADLLAAINRGPTDAATRRALVQAAQRMDRLRWVPDSWPEKPTQAAPLAPGAAQKLHEAAYGAPKPPPQTEAERRRQVALEPVAPVRVNRHPRNGGRNA